MTEKLYPGKPLIRNAVHPDDLFMSSEIGILKDCLERARKQTIGKKGVTVPARERAKVAHLLEQARFNGYFMDHVNEHGQLVWGCMLVTPIKKAEEVVMSIMPCEKCGANFHSYHYGDEEPSVLCWGCVPKKRHNITPPHLKRISHR